LPRHVPIFLTLLISVLVGIFPSATAKVCIPECLGLLYEVNQAEQTKTYHYDQVGSAIARTDDTGKVIGKAGYSAYGLCYWKQGDMATPFLYNGQAGVQTDPNGLLNMRARYYSPYLMRFLNADPIGFSGGSNWFAYADGNPISLNDPFGLEAQIGSIRGNMSNGGRGANPTTGQMGYIDAFGDWHQSFCMSCHDANDPYAQRNMQAAIGGDLGWWIMGRDVFMMAAPLGIEAVAARGTMTMANSAMRAESSAQGAMLRMQLAAEEIAGARLPSSFGGYTNHGMKQVLGRDGGLGVADTAVLDAFNNPVIIMGQTGKYGGAFKMTGQNATIVVNPQGQVITGYGTNSAGLRSP
jgi:RHS repeat-associated protein